MTLIEAEIIFITSVALLAYASVGYPLFLFAASLFRRQPIRTANITPTISVIIAAHNEEEDIAEKIENTLALDYPLDKLEIIVASDSSTDRTDEIVRSFASRGVVLYRQNERLGKTMAQNSAAVVSSGDILVFTDATTAYQKDVLRKIVRCFADPEVGCVGGQLLYIDPSQTTVGRGCRSYWSYEKFIKSCESKLGSLIGVSGCLYAVRRCCYTPLSHDMSSDFVIASDIRLKGLRTVYEPDAICTEFTNQRPREEFRMRVRVIEQTMTAMRRYHEVLSVRRHGMFAFQMISHKVLRYAVPAMLLLVLISNWFLVSDSRFYQAAAAFQIVFYLSALGGFVLEKFRRRPGVFGLPYYFVFGNVAIVAAFVKFLRGETHVVWDPMRDSNLPARQITKPVMNG